MRKITVTARADRINSDDMLLIKKGRREVEVQILGVINDLDNVQFLAYEGTYSYPARTMLRIKRWHV